MKNELAIFSKKILHAAVWLLRDLNHSFQVGLVKKNTCKFDVHVYWGRRHFNESAGFTLVELIIVILIGGILAMVAANFVSRPISQYQDLARRAEISDTANTAVRRMSRELHLALPNSIRYPNGNCVEFLQTKDGGRYRSAAPGKVFLTEATSGNEFDVLGNLNALPANGDLLVVYNLGIPGADAYQASYRGVIASAGTTSNLIKLSTEIQNPLDSPSKRFYILSGTSASIFFVCENAGIDANKNGTGRLFRVSGYGINAAAPGACPVWSGAATQALLAENVSSCSFNYSTGVVERNGIMSIRLGIQKLDESVNLYQDVNINNVP
jgi:MSHA biogenesis protein MshO